MSKTELDDLKPLAKAAGYTSVTKYIRECFGAYFDMWIQDEYEFHQP